MLEPKYRLVTFDNDCAYFEFCSTGPKGKILKVVSYLETEIKGVYNLGFGDILDDGNVTDKVVSNNEDGDKVLATVASTLKIFFGKYPKANVLVQAVDNDKRRLRKYQMGISKYLDEISQDFTVFGLKNRNWIPFERGINFDAFMVKYNESL